MLSGSWSKQFLTFALLKLVAAVLTHRKRASRLGVTRKSAHVTCSKLHVAMMHTPTQGLIWSALYVKGLCKPVGPDTICAQCNVMMSLCGVDQWNPPTSNHMHKQHNACVCMCASLHACLLACLLACSIVWLIIWSICELVDGTVSWSVVRVCKFVYGVMSLIVYLFSCLFDC